MLDFTSLLEQVTVNSKDDGHQFQVFNRVDAIRSLLSQTDYKLVHEGKLFMLYAKQPIEGQDIVLISSHIDCVYSQCFCREEDDTYQGTFDNSLTNAAVLYNMLHGYFADNVVIAFTGDEEKDSAGCHELIEYLFNQPGTEVRFALVTDVSNEGWDEGVPFSVENDLGIDLFTAHDLVVWLEPYLYKFVHYAEPDESWDYHCVHIPTMTLCVPVEGDMHHDAGVRARKRSVPIYCQVLAELANRLAVEP